MAVFAVWRRSPVCGAISPMCFRSEKCTCAVGACHFCWQTSPLPSSEPPSGPYEIEQQRANCRCPSPTLPWCLQQHPPTCSLLPGSCALPLPQPGDDLQSSAWPESVPVGYWTADRTWKIRRTLSIWIFGGTSKEPHPLSSQLFVLDQDSTNIWLWQASQV